ncbi:MAG: CPBP family intramembrane metalloprotease [Lachnospiraceae bacterium]|nr:CPBP family intramembrane metalloprotease [Lachnospiraceae bacterium]
MKQRQHKVLDHPILGYFLLAIYVSIFTSIGGLIDSLIARFLPGYGVEMTVYGRTAMTASGVGYAFGALLGASIFFFWFRPNFKGFLKKKDIAAGLLMLLPFLLVHYTGSVVSWFEFGIGNVLIAFLRAFAPGFSEEFMFRGLGIANFMRTIKEEKQITTIWILSSVVFGLIHILNGAVGADPVAAIIQSIYAIGVGLILGAVYLRTGNLWPTIIGHLTVDFMEFIRGDMSKSGGLMIGMGIGDWITIAASVVAVFLAIRLMNKKYYPEIMELWNDKWSMNEPAKD